MNIYKESQSRELFATDKSHESIGTNALSRVHILLLRKDDVL